MLLCCTFYSNKLLAHQGIMPSSYVRPARWYLLPEEKWKQRVTNSITCPDYFWLGEKGGENPQGLQMTQKQVHRNRLYALPRVNDV